MLNQFYESTQKHFLLSCFSFLASCALIGMAVVGTVSTDVHYLVFLPVGLMCLLSSTFGLMILADEAAPPAKKKAYFSIEAALLFFALLLLPPSWWAFNSL